MTALWERSAADLAGMIRRREVSARELLGATLTRIDDVNPAVNAVVTLVPEMAEAWADEADVATAREMLQNRDYGLCLTDMRLPDGDGIELVEWMQAHAMPTPVAVITAHGHVETAGLLSCIRSLIRACAVVSAA